MDDTEAVEPTKTGDRPEPLRQKLLRMNQEQMDLEKMKIQNDKNAALRELAKAKECTDTSAAVRVTFYENQIKDLDEMATILSDTIDSIKASGSK